MRDSAPQQDLDKMIANMASSSQHVADSHDPIRVQGAREETIDLMMRVNPALPHGRGLKTVRV